MKSLLRWIAISMGTLWFVLILIASFMAYFVKSQDGTFDGLGRRLTPSPPLIRILFDTDWHWAGSFWFIVDLGVFWVSIAIAFLLARVFKEIDAGK